MLHSEDRLTSGRGRQRIPGSDDRQHTEPDERQVEHMAPTIEHMLMPSHRWAMRIVVLDSKPYSALRRYVKSLADDRIEVYAEWVSRRTCACLVLSVQSKRTINVSLFAQIGADYSEMIGDYTYNAKLFNLTDEAIRSCPANTGMVVVALGYITCLHIKSERHSRRFFHCLMQVTICTTVLLSPRWRRQRLRGQTFSRQIITHASRDPLVAKSCFLATKKRDIVQC